MLFIFIDGLDESQDCDKVLSKFLAHCQRVNIKALTTRHREEQIS